MLFPVRIYISSLSPSVLPTPGWDLSRAQLMKCTLFQRDHTTGAWDRLGVLCGSLLGSLSEG